MKALLSSKVLVYFVVLLFLRSCEVNQPPSCNISAPTDGFRAVKGDVIAVSVRADDEEGDITEVRLLLNKSALVSLDYPFDYEINTAKFTPGNYSIEAIAVDKEGLQSRDEVDFILHPTGWNSPD
ncbi:MAG: Ig-like domain-containing protein [Bacteroidota bacterium]